MDLPQFEQLGPPLPKGWWRPTPDLVRQVQLWMNEGIAMPSSPHLYLPAPAFNPSMLNDERVRAGRELLRYLVAPNPTPFWALGMASTQLDIDRLVRTRIISLMLDIPDLTAAGIPQ